jgi:hypothetical protein
MWIIWPGSLTARPSAGTNWPSNAASSPPASPGLKTLDQFDWNWPKKINRPQVQNLFRLAFLKDKTNVIFMGGRRIGQIAFGQCPGP